MRTMLAALALAGVLSAQTTPRGQQVRPQKRMMPDSLLLESYQLGKELAPLDRAILLNYLSLAAGRRRLACTSAWAEENLLLAKQLPMTWNRWAVEKNSLVAMSFVKPDRAVALIRSMELPSEVLGFREDLRSDGANTIFGNYWRAHQTKGVTRLRDEATYVGQTGQYPYRAVEHIVVNLADTAKKGQREISATAQSFVTDAYFFYRRGSEFEVEDDEFVEFLQTLHPIIPAALLKQGLELAVERLLDKDRPHVKQGYLRDIQTENGTAVFQRRQDALLFDLLPLIRELDPAWAEQVIQRDPALGQAGGNNGKQVLSEGITIPGDSATASDLASGLQQSRADAVGQLAQTDPTAARRLAQTVVDPYARAIALANFAAAVGPSSPNEAAEIEKNIDDSMPALKDAGQRLNVLAALVKAAAAAGDEASLQVSLDRCLALGEDLFDEDSVADPANGTYNTPAYAALSDAVESAAPISPMIVAGKVHEIRSVPLKAYLLYNLAEVLYSTTNSSEDASTHKNSSKNVPQPR